MASILNGIFHLQSTAMAHIRNISGDMTTFKYNGNSLELACMFVFDDTTPSTHIAYSTEHYRQ